MGRKPLGLIEPLLNNTRSLLSSAAVPGGFHVTRSADTASAVMHRVVVVFVASKAPLKTNVTSPFGSGCPTAHVLRSTGAVDGCGAVVGASVGVATPLVSAVLVPGSLEPGAPLDDPAAPTEFVGVSAEFVAMSTGVFDAVPSGALSDPEQLAASTARTMLRAITRARGTVMVLRVQNRPVAERIHGEVSRAVGAHQFWATEVERGRR